MSWSAGRWVIGQIHLTWDKGQRTFYSYGRGFFLHCKMSVVPLSHVKCIWPMTHCPADQILVNVTETRNKCPFSLTDVAAVRSKINSRLAKN